MSTASNPGVGRAVLADELFDAWQRCVPVAPLRDRADLSIADAYAVAHGFVERRVTAGESVVGKKIGVTSKAMQDLLGVAQPDFGQLTSGMDRSATKTIDVGGLIAPRAEAELAFVLAADLIGPGITAIDVINATDYVAPCIEIVDSRIRNWDIGIIDTIADNASCGEFVVGDDRADIRDVEVNTAGMTVLVDGEVVTTGAGSAVQGGPVNAVAWLANTLGALGVPFRAGEVILSGSQSVLVPATAGTELTCIIAGLGSCSVSFVDPRTDNPRNDGYPMSDEPPMNNVDGGRS